MPDVLGVDYGGVICSRLQGMDVEGTYPPLEDVFLVLARLKKERFAEVFVISYIERGKGDEERILVWLDGHRFSPRTGISMANVLFCYERKDKAPKCQEQKITHFIDDRAEIMEYLVAAGIPNLYLFQGRDDEVLPRISVLSKVCLVNSWREVEAKLLG